MATFSKVLGYCCFMFFVCSWISNCPSYVAEDKRQLYIVYRGNLPEQDYSLDELQEQHREMLENVIHPSFLSSALVTSYHRSFDGFSAYLTEQEKNTLAGHRGVVSIFPSHTLQLQTTRSWDYMGLTEEVFKNTRFSTSSDVIIGVIDSGIWPHSESFSDKGFGPIPKKWKGQCIGGKGFTCNRKLIGARYFSQKTSDYLSDSAWDTVGHGTFNAAIAGGNYVRGTSFFGIAGGTSRGGLPSARIAVYKACSGEEKCPANVVLSAFDAAIADGVDIISISLGDNVHKQLLRDAAAIGALHALQKGILTVQAAGNNGPEYGTTISVAPWLLSVGASTMDRGIVTKIELGNNKTIVGKGLHTFKLAGTGLFPLVRGGSNGECAERCDPQCWDKKRVKGKIVLCEEFHGLSNEYHSGAVGFILKAPDGMNDCSEHFPVPVATVDNQDFQLLESYIKSTRNANAFISTSEAIKEMHAPKVASFSSRGPNNIVPNILKPDMTAPGVEILAAYPPHAPLTDDPRDNRSTKYSIKCGTSMACPHVSGAAAYVKAVHPNWSPSAIKSALMTTSRQLGHAAGNIFGFGAGYLDPVDAIDPGLVYETGMEEYIKLLCKLRYPDEILKNLFKDKSIECSRLLKPSDHTKDDFNYPSMTIPVDEKKSLPLSASFARTVTNVGLPNSTYKVHIFTDPLALHISVEPQILSFRKLNEKKTFTVNLQVRIHHPMTATIVWYDGIHLVRSPIVVQMEAGP